MATSSDSTTVPQVQVEHTTTDPQVEQTSTAPQPEFRIDRLYLYSAAQLRDFLYSPGLTESDCQAIERLCKTRALAEELAAPHHHRSEMSESPEIERNTPDTSEPDSDYPKYNKYRKGVKITTVSTLKRGSSLLQY